MLTIAAKSMTAYIGPGVGISIPWIVLIAAGLLVIAVLIWIVVRKR